MKASEIQIGHDYNVRIGMSIPSVRVLRREGKGYVCTNNRTGRPHFCKSAAAFRSEADPDQVRAEIELSKAGK